MTAKNNIPVGYKDSVVGIIPQEWEVKPFKNLGAFLRTNTLSRERMNNVEGLALNIHYGDVLVRYGEILDCSKSAIPWVNNNCQETRLGDRLQNGDIVISDTAEDYTVGKATEVCNVSDNCVLSGLHTMAFRPHKETFALRYLGYYFNSPTYRAQLYSLIQGIKVCSISKNAISNTYILVPLMEEQRKIAEILGVWDEAIDKQSRLIEKLELRKRALMQRLLTGRTRLPSFTTPWQKVKLGAICKEFVLRNTDDNNYIVLSCTKYNGLVSSLDYFGKQIFSDNLRTYKVVPKHHFAYATNHIEEGSIGYQGSYDYALISPMYTVFKADETKVDNYFLYTLLKTPLMIYNYQSRIEGSIDRRGGLRWDAFAVIIIKLPSLPEQKAIAEILTTADNEIATHRKKLDALRLQKRGLMQQLLTGKTRVKI